MRSLGVAQRCLLVKYASVLVCSEVGNTDPQGSGISKHCTTHQYACWSAIWNVTFHLGDQTIETNVTDETKYEDRTEAREYISEYKIGSKYELWYNVTNPVEARFASKILLTYERKVDFTKASFVFNFDDNWLGLCCYGYDCRCCCLFT